jgi:hypothetical protein
MATHGALFPRGDGQDEKGVGMRGPIKALLVCGALITPAFGVAGVTVAPAASAAAATSDSCSPTASDIHWGTVNGRATIMFTGQVECNFSGTSILVHVTLFACGSQQPKEKKGWLLADCGYGTNDQTFTPQEAGVTYSISAPASTEVFTGSGYYASLFNFTNNGGTNVGTSVFGTPAHCTSGSAGDTCTNTTYAS